MKGRQFLDNMKVVWFSVAILQNKVLEEGGDEKVFFSLGMNGNKMNESTRLTSHIRPPAAVTYFSMKTLCKDEFH